MKEKKNENIIEGLKKMLDEAGVDYTIEEVAISNKSKKDKRLKDEVKDALSSAKEELMETSKSYLGEKIDRASSTTEKIIVIDKYIKAVLAPALDILDEVKEDIGIRNVVIYFDGIIDNREYCNANVPANLKTTADILEFFADMTMKILKAKNKFNINEDADEDE